MTTHFTKVSYPILHLQVEKLYDEPIDPENLKAIQKQTETIQALIEACGWTWDEYLWEWSGLGKMN